MIGFECDHRHLAGNFRKFLEMCLKFSESDYLIELRLDHGPNDMNGNN